MSRVVHFEIPCNDPKKVSSFYKSIFGWEISKWDGPAGAPEYWLVSTGPDGVPGINGGLMRRQHAEQPIVNTIDVDSVDEFAKKVEAAGGEIVVPKMPVPGIGYLCYFKDVEGHIFGMMQVDHTVAM